jgi:hypothetical protein
VYHRDKLVPSIALGQAERTQLREFSSLAVPGVAQPHREYIPVEARLALESRLRHVVSQLPFGIIIKVL